MAIQGKKINELDSITTVSDATVFPAVYVEGSTTSSTANKVSISQLKDNLQEDFYTKGQIDTLVGLKQDALTAGANITIEEDSDENLVISSTASGGKNYVAGTGISITEDSDENYIISATGGSGIVDQNYNATSSNAQSGIAVSQAISTKQNKLTAGNNITIADNQTIANYTVVGTPTISSNVVSNFSQSNYLKGPIQPTDTITSFVMNIKFKTSTNTSIGTYKSLYGQTTTNKYTPQLAVTNDGRIGFSITPDGQNWSTVQSSFSLLDNTTYWVRGVWDGTEMQLFYSTDGTTYTRTYSTGQEQVLLASVYWVEQIAIGLDTGINPFPGSIYLEDCSIEINGSVYWKAIDNGTVISSSALQNTATGTSSLTILGTASSNTGTVNIGASSVSAGGMSTSIGVGANTNYYGVAVGNGAGVTSGQSYQSTVAIGQAATNYGAASISIGKDSNAAGNSVSIGTNAGDTASTYATRIGNDAHSTSNAIAIGYGSNANAAYSIQLGQGTNTTANSLSVGLSESNNYQLLDSAGKIPLARLPIVQCTQAEYDDLVSGGTVDANTLYLIIEESN